MWSVYALLPCAADVRPSTNLLTLLSPDKTVQQSDFRGSEHTSEHASEHASEHLLTPMNTYES